MKLKVSALFCLFCCVSFLYAEKKADENAVIVVSSSKIEESSDEAVEKVEVITNEDIKQSGAKTLSEAVRNNAGIVISGHPTDSISMQGFSGKYVKILIDGVAVSGDLGGATPVYQIPVEDIERIEIIKGASSALYGSDAMGGVINIITKKNKASKKDAASEKDNAGKRKFNIDFSTEFASNIRTYTSAGFSYTGPKFSGSATGSFDWNRGFIERLNTVLKDDVKIYKVPSNRLGFVRAKGDWNITGGSIGIYGLFSDSLKKTNTSKYETMNYGTKRFEGGLTGKKTLSDAWLLSGFASAKFYMLDTEFKNIVDDNIRNGKSRFLDGETEIRAAWDPNIFNSVLAGFNANFQTIQGDSFRGIKKQLLLSLYAQDTITIGASEQFLIVPGLRFDIAPPLEQNKILWQITPKLSLKYNPFKSTALRFAYGMGYRIPTFKQKHWLFTHDYASGAGNFILYGNPNLKPETSHGFNLDLEQKIGKFVNLNVSGYFNYIQNLIDNHIIGYDPGSGKYNRSYGNVDKALTFGGGISVHSKFKRTVLGASYAYTGAMGYSASHGKYIDLAARVPHRVTASALYTIPVIETDVSLRIEWNSPELIDYDLAIYSPDFLMAGLTIDKKFLKNKIDVYARVDNMLNNVHFKKGSLNTTQKEHFGLHHGVIFAGGIKLHF